MVMMHWPLLFVMHGQEEGVQNIMAAKYRPPPSPNILRVGFCIKVVIHRPLSFDMVRKRGFKILRPWNIEPPSHKHFYCADSEYGCETLTPCWFWWLRGGVSKLYDFKVWNLPYISKVWRVSPISQYNFD
jgi:hypothetical protein